VTVSCQLSAVGCDCELSAVAGRLLLLWFDGHGVHRRRFRTSNSSVSVSGRRSAQILPIDPRARRPELYRSVIFFPDEGEAFTGARAINEYLEQGQGRLVQSVKASSQPQLHRYPDPGEDSTAGRAGGGAAEADPRGGEEALGRPPCEVVLGRPAPLSRSIARPMPSRRNASATRPGSPASERVSFEIEPIAAALAYEATWRRNGWWLVGDFGAGTSDYTLMRLGPRHRVAETAKATSWPRRGAGRWRSIRFRHHGAAPAAALGGGSTYQLMSNRLPMPPSELQEAPAHQGSPHPNQDHPR